MKKIRMQRINFLLRKRRTLFQLHFLAFSKKSKAKNTIYLEKMPRIKVERHRVRKTAIA